MSLLHLFLLSLPRLGSNPDLLLLVAAPLLLLVEGRHVLLKGARLDGLQLADAGEQPGIVVPKQTRIKATHLCLSTVADTGCLSRIPNPTFFRPGSEFFPSRIHIKEFKYL